MAVNPTKQSFYREVDRYRYRTNWGCLGWVVIVIILAGAVAWWWLNRV